MSVRTGDQTAGNSLQRSPKKARAATVRATAICESRTVGVDERTIGYVMSQPWNRKFGHKSKAEDKREKGNNTNWVAQREGWQHLDRFST